MHWKWLVALAKVDFCSTTMPQQQSKYPSLYNIVRGLLAMSEEEFGPPGDGPITLPCNAVFMEHVVSLFQGIVDEEMENTVVMSV
ncbi:hypothetical protein BDE02_04G155600 [Populus trichocarpa]|nr:hypothetical protein BDE02_04G155600 [Populus trichocarpa]